MPTFLGVMAGQGLTGAGGVIFADAGGGWWIVFPVESEGIMDGGDLREVKEIEMAHLDLRADDCCGRLEGGDPLLCLVRWLPERLTYAMGTELLHHRPPDPSGQVSASVEP